MTLFNRAGATFAGFVLVLCAWSLGAQPLPVAKPEQVGMSAQRLAKIGEALKKEAADGSFRGAVVMVARKGKLVYQDAVGMQTAAAKMTPDSIFRIYSMTKPLVSVAAMMLVEDGVIQLTDPTSRLRRWRLCRSRSSRGRRGTTACPLICSAAWWRKPRAGASRISSRSVCSSRSG